MLEEGKAIAFFKQSFPKFIHPTDTSVSHAWPLIDRLLVKGVIDPVDCGLARRYATNQDENLAALIVYLSLAARQGHLCVNIQALDPAPSQLFKMENGNEGIDPSDIDLFCSQVTEGAMYQKLPSALIKQKGSLYYLQRYWKLERDFIEGLTGFMDRSKSTCGPAIDVDKASAYVNTTSLLDEQKDAVLKACQHSLTVISGGPGTGKTFTAGILLRALLAGMNEEQRRSCRLVLAAPTGKAAANLEASLKKTSEVGMPPTKATTLHQLLKMNRVNRHLTIALDADIIVVDECSMIDVEMMGCLFASLKSGARLILLGDKHQLPSVEAGSIFADLADLLLADEGTKGAFSELTTCLRAESQQIVQLASSIKKGDLCEVNRCLDSTSNIVRLRRLSDEMNDKDLQRSIVKEVVHHYPDLVEGKNSPQSLFERIRSFQLLTPMRKGALGVEELNKAIYNAMRSKMRQGGALITPILITENHHRMDLYNGEIGMMISDAKESLSYALFPLRDAQGGLRRIPIILLPKHELAYCLSIHKSQGSEFNHVLLVLPKGSEVFGRAALYTGVTRAKQKLDIWCSDVTLQQMVASSSRRLSGINLNSAVEDATSTQSFEP